MLHLRPRAVAPAAVSAFVLLMGGTAQAALTADQVWASWKDGLGKAGLSVTTATESASGGVLTLNGITVAPEGMPGGLTISDLVLREQSDGSVTITPGASIGLAAGDDKDGMKLSLTHDGLALTAREGEGGAVVYDLAAAHLDADMNVATKGYSFDEAQEEAKSSTATAKVAIAGLSGRYTDTPGTSRALGLSLKADRVSADVASDDPGLAVKSASKTETESLTLDFALTLPASIELAKMESAADFATALREGFAVRLHSEQGASSGTASQENDMFPYQMTMTGKPGTADFVFDKDRFQLATSYEGFDIEASSPAIPAPVKVASGPLVFNLLAPVLASEVAGDYALAMKLKQFTLNDEVWGLFDPQGALKRDPFDLVIDLAGKARIDWFALAEAEETGAAPAAPQPENLDIRDISLKVAGAAAHAAGAFTFDNSMGIPMPKGEAEVTVTGANALIDGLIKTGLLEEQDAEGMRAMMGAFMQPGSEPDSLVSKIEAKEGGQIFVNGQQIQ